MTVRIRGITWAHARGYSPLAACSRVYQDWHPEVEVQWDQRSLWSFGDEPFAAYAARYDLLVIDHPFVGYGVDHGLLLAMEDVLSPAGVPVDDEFIGPCLASYRFRGRTWALPVDAAAQVAVTRPDLLPPGDVPRTWSSLIELASRTRRVVTPLTPVNAFCLFLAMCSNHGSRFGPAGFAHPELAAEALVELRRLADVMPAWCFEVNPIETMRRMTTTDDWLYGGPLFGYSNYARPGYARRRLAFHEIPGWLDTTAGVGSTLGGAGMAISSSCREVDAAADVAWWLTSADCQSTEYVFSGGQPAAAAAWNAALPNELTSGYFAATASTIRQASLRPNWVGMDAFQPRAAEAVVAFLRGSGLAHSTVSAISALAGALLSE